jgi:molybdopterin converting factor small subunit
MRIHLTYYASLREQRGTDRETIEVGSASLRDLYRALVRSYRFSYAEEQVRPAVNDEFSQWDRPLGDGDRVVFVPPVSGG